MALKAAALLGCTMLLILLSLFMCSCQAKKTQPAVAKGTDCTQIKNLFPKSRNGVYIIQPPGITKAIKVYCVMLPDGGWTVFQRRSAGQVKFDKRWSAYKNGFGDINGDHWLGLQKLWSVMRGRKWAMRVDLWDFEGNTAAASYNNFRLGTEAQAFRLHVGTYNGTAGDAIRGTGKPVDQNGHGFSTKDHDNDDCSPCTLGDITVYSCSRYEGNTGWWFSNCGSANLNGEWHPQGLNIGQRSGLFWPTWKGHTFTSVKATRMMVKAI